MGGITFEDAQVGRIGTVYIGFKLYKRSSGGSETLILDDSGNPYLINSWTGTTASLKNVTASVPLTSMDSTDSIVIKFYGKIGSGSWDQMTTGGYSPIATTEQLGASDYGGNDQTFEAYARRNYLFGQTWVLLSFGNLEPYNTKIIDFQWTPYEEEDGEEIDCDWIGINSTLINASTLFSADWTDTNQTNGLSHFRFSTNNTGTWQNDTWQDSWYNSNWSRSTKTLNDTENLVIAFRFFINDSNGDEYESTIAFFPSIEGGGFGEGFILGLFIVGILAFVCFLIFQKGH